jgi:hypothetical protein
VKNWVAQRKATTSRNGGKGGPLRIQGNCLAVLERVRKNGKPILVTRFGQPITRIEPPNQALGKQIKLGGMDKMEILGDIVGPIIDISDWEAAQDPEDES